MKIPILEKNIQDALSSWVTIQDIVIKDNNKVCWVLSVSMVQEISGAYKNHDGKFITMENRFYYENPQIFLDTYSKLMRILAIRIKGFSIVKIPIKNFVCSSDCSKSRL